MFDTHIHTLPFSTDSEMTIDQLLTAQEKSGLDFVLTEHMDFDFPGPDYFGFDGTSYFKQYAPYRNPHLLLGVEIGLLESAADKNREFVRSHPFDMVIGSLHVVKDFDIYYKEFYQGFSGKKQAYEAYLQAMLANLKLYDDFDTLGHIDYVCRCAPYEDKQLYYQDFSHYLDEILKLLLEKGKVLELNTRRLGSPDALKALLPLYQRYYDLGGRYVTIGSDAHKSEAVGMNLNAAYSFAARCQLTPVYFKERKLTLV